MLGWKPIVAHTERILSLEQRVEVVDRLMRKSTRESVPLGIDPDDFAINADLTGKPVIAGGDYDPMADTR